MDIRKARRKDIDGIVELFKNTVINICKADYGNEQINVWAAAAENKQKWIDRIDQQYFLVAEQDNKIIGFGSIENGDYLDVMYIHKDYLRQGIAGKILEKLEKESERKHKNSITSDVSITAKPFFEKHGFKVVREQRNLINNVEIINFRMIKIKNISVF